MEKYIAKSRNLPSILICCWEESRNAEKQILFDYLIASVPKSIHERMKFFPGGARWPTELRSDKFTQMYAKRGAKDLRSLSQIAFVDDRDNVDDRVFDVNIRCSTERQVLKVYGSAEFWSLVNTEKYVSELLRLFPVFFGQMSDIPVLNYQSTGRQIEYPI